MATSFASIRVAFFVLLSGLAVAQPATQTSPTPAAFTLKVTPQRLVSIDARAAIAADIGKALSLQLNAPVRMSSLVAQRPITLKATSVPIENVLLALAPQVYIDYEVRWDRPQEDWVGVELTGFNEREPRTLVEAKAFLVLAGSTEDEDVTEETIARDKAAADEKKLEKEVPKTRSILDVAVKDGLVSIRAQRQMAAAIVLEAASKAGIGFETRGALDQTLIDLEVRSTPIEQLPAVMGRPGIAVLMRRNLTTGGTRPVAVLLGSEATHVQKPAVAVATPRPAPGPSVSPKPSPK